MPIGGLKEKLLAAHRGGINTVIIPDENEKDLADMPKNILGRLEIHPVKWIDEVLELALDSQPEPRSDEPADVSGDKRNEKSDDPTDQIRPH